MAWESGTDEPLPLYEEVQSVPGSRREKRKTFGSEAVPGD
jgi:hypothetical protein